MEEIKRQARIAGAWYVLMALTAPIGLMIVPGQLIVARDATATAANLAASGWLLRVGIASELFHQVTAIFVAMALYRVFRGVSEIHARLMVILSLVGIPIVFLNVLNELAALNLVGGAPYLSTFDKPQLDSLAYLFLRLHGQGLTVASIFWGLWLFPFGWLVIRSGFMPRVLGVLLWVAGVAYVASSFTTLVLPQYAPQVNPVALVLEIAEVPIIFWLAIWGVRAKAPASA